MFMFHLVLYKRWGGRLRMPAYLEMGTVRTMRLVSSCGSERQQHLLWQVIRPWTVECRGD